MTTLRETIRHHRDLTLAYLRLGDKANSMQHAEYAREYTIRGRARA